MRRIAFTLLLLSFITLSAMAEEDPIVAEYPGGQITQTDLLFARNQNGNGATDETLILRLIRERMIAEKALAQGLDKEPGVKWRLWLADKQTGISDLYQQEVADRIVITTDELKQRYQDQIQRFRRPEVFSFHYIFCDTTECKTPQEVDEMRLKAEQALKELLAPLGENPQKPWIVSATEFIRVATTYSSTGERASRIAGPFTIDEPIQPVIKENALKLVPGEISPVFKTRYGFEILRLESRVKASTDEFEKVRGKLEFEARKEKVAELSKRYLDRLKYDSSLYSIYRGQLENIIPGANTFPATTTIVAVAGDVKFSTEEVREFMNTLHARTWRRTWETPAATEMVYTQMILPVLLHQQAKKGGFVDKPSEVARARNVRYSILAEAWVQEKRKTRLADLPDPATDECRAYYDNNLANFRIPAMYHMSMIIFPASKEVLEGMKPADVEFLLRKGMRELQTMLGKVRAGEDPTRVVETAPVIDGQTFRFAKETYSDGTNFPPEVWQTLTQMTPGSWTEKPLRAVKGVFIGRMNQVDPESTRSFEQEFPMIQQTLKQQVLQKELQKFWDDLLEEARGKTKFFNIDN